MPDSAQLIAELEASLAKAKEALEDCKKLAAAVKDYPRPHPAADPRRGERSAGVFRDALPDPCAGYAKAVRELNATLEKARRSRPDDRTPSSDIGRSSSWREMEDRLARQAFQSLLRGKSAEEMGNLRDFMEQRLRQGGKDPRYIDILNEVYEAELPNAPH